MSNNLEQDWTPVVLRKPTGTKKISPEVFVDKPEKEIKIKYVSNDISQLIIAGRVAKKLTRKQLANELNYKEDVITDIETGKAIYNGNIIARIKRFLGVK